MARRKIHYMLGNTGDFGVFGKPALCGRTNWMSLANSKRMVTCKRCLELLAEKHAVASLFCEHGEIKKHMVKSSHHFLGDWECFGPAIRGKDGLYRRAWRTETDSLPALSARVAELEEALRWLLAVDLRDPAASKEWSKAYDALHGRAAKKTRYE